MMNPIMRMTLDEAVGEVLNLLTGLDMHYIPELDRYRAITRHLNRALRSVALDNEWSYYADTIEVGPLAPGAISATLPGTVRPRISGDDAVRLVDSQGVPHEWAYILPRDALHKYRHRGGLWAAVVRDKVWFSRPLHGLELEWKVQVPIMREPNKLILPYPRENIESLDTPALPAAYIEQKRNFLLPDVVEEWIMDPASQPRISDDPEASLRATMLDTQGIRMQEIDFFYPDLIVLRAAYYYSQSDPVMQPRVQTLEQQYKNLMYQVIERDTAFTDSPYLNEFQLPVQGGIYPNRQSGHHHPHSDWRW